MEKFGQVSRCDLPMPGGISKGIAFVDFEDDREQSQAPHLLLVPHTHTHKHQRAVSLSLMFSRAPP